MHGLTYLLYHREDRGCWKHFKKLPLPFTFHLNTLDKIFKNTPSFLAVVTLTVELFN